MLRDLPDTADNLRQRMMNFYATEVISMDPDHRRARANGSHWWATAIPIPTKGFRGSPNSPASACGSDAAAGRHLGVEVDTGRTASLGIGKGEGNLLEANLSCG